MPFDAFGDHQPIHPDVEALREAREAIEDGWVKYCYHTKGRGGHDRYCAVAAIAVTCGDARFGRGWMNTSTRRLVRELASDLPRTGNKVAWRVQGPKGRVIMFNDNRHTTLPQVLSAFDRTIARLERQHERRSAFAFA